MQQPIFNRLATTNRFTKVFVSAAPQRQKRVCREDRGRSERNRRDWYLMRLTKRGWAASVCVRLQLVFAVCLYGPLALWLYCWFKWMSLQSSGVFDCLSVRLCSHVRFVPFDSKLYWKADLVTCFYLVCLGSHCRTSASKLKPTQICVCLVYFIEQWLSTLPSHSVFVQSKQIHLSLLKFNKVVSAIEVTYWHPLCSTCKALRLGGLGAFMAAMLNWRSKHFVN